MIRKGQDWGDLGTPGSPSSNPDLTVTGDDRDLATAMQANPGSLVWFRPHHSDLARAIGLAERSVGASDSEDASTGEGPGTVVLTIDAIALDLPGAHHRGSETSLLAVNAVVLGQAPDRLWWGSRARRITVRVDDRIVHDGPATSVVIASGQFVRGNDLIPRGHPGDGRIEVQVYAPKRAERRLMRGRIGNGSHVPHPRIRQWSGRSVTLSARRPWATEVDNHPIEPTSEISARVASGQVRLLV